MLCLLKSLRAALKIYRSSHITLPFFQAHQADQVLGPERMAAQALPKLATAIRSCCPVDPGFLRCRSESLSQALLESLTDIDPDGVQRSGSAVLDFLDDTRALTMVAQHTRGKASASESVHKLAKLPGMLQSSTTLAYPKWETAALWLISVVSNTCTPGISHHPLTENVIHGQCRGVHDIPADAQAYLQHPPRVCAYHFCWIHESKFGIMPNSLVQWRGGLQAKVHPM